MDDGTQLNVDFYKRLKEGKTSLSEEEKRTIILLQYYS